MKNSLILSLIFLTSCEPLSRVRDLVPPTVLSSEIKPTPYPFFAELSLTLSSSEVTANEVYFEVIPKPNHRAKSISAVYFKERARFQQRGDKLSIPIFGLYQDFENTVRLRVSFDGYTQSTSHIQRIKTPPYKRNDESFWNPEITMITPPTRELGFSYFLFESNVNKRHVVMDIDGELRWALPLSEVKRQINPFRSDSRHTFGSVWFDPENASFVLQRDNKLYFSPITSANPPGADRCLSSNMSLKIIKFT